MRARDQLLVGTNRGLFALPATAIGAAPQSSAPQRLLGGNAMFVRPVQAAAWSDSALLLVTDRRAHLLSLDRTLQGTNDSASASASDSVFSEFDVQTIGPIHAAAIDARALWVIGRNGVLTRSRVNGATRMLRAGVDLPANVTAIALADSWAWIGTDRGLVRVKRATDGGLP
jgi:ligand-binding sensor domain-containing protein